MIDSGAFTKHNAKGNFDHINLDSYCSFLDEFAPFADKYVMLDVIGNRNLSVCNYETMLKRGLNPMFVFTTYDTDFAYLREAVRNNRDICVAGGEQRRKMTGQLRGIKTHICKLTSKQKYTPWDTSRYRMSLG